MSDPAIYFKYRDFKGCWQSIFRECGFWFSVARNLDDEEEIALEFDPPHLEPTEWTGQIRNGSSILSLGCSPANEALGTRVQLNRTIHCEILDNFEGMINRIWKKVYFQKSRALWSEQEKVRFLHGEDNAPTGYKGKLRTGPAPALRKVYISEHCMCAENRAALTAEIEKLYRRTGHRIAVVSMEE